MKSSDESFNCGICSDRVSWVNMSIWHYSKTTNAINVRIWALIHSSGPSQHFATIRFVMPKLSPLERARAYGMLKTG